VTRTASSNSSGAYTPFLIGKARKLNEHLPAHVTETVVAALRDGRGETTGLRLAVLGWAYKGWRRAGLWFRLRPALPLRLARAPTDDMRGAAIDTMMPIFTAAGINVVGHDPLVSPDVIGQHGGEPVGLDEAFAGTDAILVLNDHPDYSAIDIKTLLGDTRPVLIYDSWRILDANTITGLGIRYAGLGFLPASVG
jgi:UDP-N-acetyl-D-mannosaminuronic acid dehydrogenase